MNALMRVTRRGPCRGAVVLLAGLLGSTPCLVGAANPSVVGSGYDTSAGTGTLGPATPGQPVTRAQMIARARDWIHHDVPYSKSEGWRDAAVGGPYRMDCSGFISMVWGLSTSEVTSELPQDSTVTDTDVSGDTKLAPGDALDYTADHVVLFDHWADKSGDFVYDSEHTFRYGADQNTGNIYDSTLEGFAMSDFEALQYDGLGGGPTSQ